MEGYQPTVQAIDFKMHVTANLTLTQIKSIITEAVERQLPTHKVTSINFKVSDTSDDRFGAGSPIYGLSGCDVTLIPK